MIRERMVAKDLFLTELLEKAGPGGPREILLRHPFLRGEIRGAAEVAAALERLAHPLSALSEAEAYSQPGLAAKCWDADMEGGKIRGVTAVSLDASGSGAEVSIMLSTFPSASSWRQRVMAESSHLLPRREWELPGGQDIPGPPAVPESGLDPKLPFPIAGDMVFRSPVLSKPVRGPELIRRVFAHTSAIYGDRRYGPKIQAGRSVMSFWEASVSGFPLQVANEIRFNGNREAEEMVMSMRPWPVVKLFRDQCLERTRHFLDGSYFET